VALFLNGFLLVSGEWFELMNSSRGMRGNKGMAQIERLATLGGVSDWLLKLKENIAGQQLLGSGGKILVAVSGGADSMALLHGLVRLAPEHGWELHVAHFDHQLRKRASQGDALFVKKIAQALKLPVHEEKGDVQAFALRHGLSIEMAGRHLRHSFLAKAARVADARRVALGHQSDDRVELFFLRLLRGSGSEGLAALTWKNRSPFDPDLELVRPLLNFTKAEVLSWLRQEGIRFRQDASNESAQFERNRVRQELLPFLRKFQPALDRAVLRLIDLIGMESEYISMNADAWLRQRKRGRFEELHPALQRQVIRRQLFKRGIVPGFEEVEVLRLQAGRRVMLQGDRLVWRDAEGRIQEETLPRPGFKSGRKVVEFSGEKGQVEMDELQVQWEITKPPARLRPSQPGKEHFDAQKIGPTAILRHWQPGDRFQPIGMGKAVKLQDLFTNMKVPPSRKRELAVATTSTGEIFWVETLRIGERFKLDNETRRSLKWQWRRRKEWQPDGT
jgi:tRNA(Ile)-lysidine synthase